MAERTYEQQVMWQPESGPAALTLDSTVAAATAPRRVGDGRRSFSFHTQQPDGDTGTPQGTLVLQLSNAPVMNGQLVGPTAWVDQTSLTLDVGGADSLPGMQAVLINFAGWARLKWTPGGGSGRLATYFDGVRL